MDPLSDEQFEAAAEKYYQETLSFRYQLDNRAEEEEQVSATLLKALQDWRCMLNAPVPTEPNPNYDAQAEAAAIDRILKKKAGDTKRKRKKR